jgi:hypothetical protein
MMDGAVATKRRLDGVVVGVLMGIAEDGAPLVVFPGNPVEGAVPARSTAALASNDVGSEVALLFENGDPAHPIVVGRLLHPGNEAARAEAEPLRERLELTADREIILRCGKASITLTRAGKVLIRAAYILSRSTGVNKIKGGSVQLN